MLLTALVLVLQLGSYSWVQCQQPISATATNSSELQRLTEDVAEVKESIKNLSNLLQDQLTQIFESLGGLSKAISSLNYCNNDDDETLTFSEGLKEPYILVASEELIQIADLNGERQQVVVNSSILHKAVGIDFDARKNYMFWSDVSRHKVMRARLDGTEIMSVIDTGLGFADGIAYDWISEKIYWVDPQQSEIAVVDLSGSGDHRILLRTGLLSAPRAIVLDPTTRWMYWTDWGLSAEIEKASMDGLYRTAIHSTNLLFPHTLTIDYENQDLYWADAGVERIETSKVDGSNRQLLSDYRSLGPFSITFFEGYLYWTDIRLEAVVAAPANSLQKNRQTLIQLQASPKGIEIVSRDRQAEAPNPCAADNGKCSSLCLLSAVAKEGYTCACPQGMKLAPNMRDCRK